MLKIDPHFSLNSYVAGIWLVSKKYVPLPQWYFYSYEVFLRTLVMTLKNRF